MSLLTMAGYEYVNAEQLAGFDKYKVRRWASAGFSEGGKELLGCGEGDALGCWRATGGIPRGRHAVLG